MQNIKIEERIKTLQRQMGVKDDGIISSETLTAIERRLDVDKTLPLHDLICSQKGLAALITFEISSEAYYRRYLQKPTWPGGASGVTIGIGYDLGYNKPQQIMKDWQGKIPDSDLQRLITVAGLKADDARKALRRVETVSVSLKSAQEVFYTCILPRFAAETRKAYPGIERLPADAQSALLSLVFNRGAKMTGSTRREMAAIRALVTAADLPGIAAQIRAMKRLWENTKLTGLIQRREIEAQLVEQSSRDYNANELVFV